MPSTPMLGDVELEQVQEIETDQDQVLSQHAVPALEGDFLQRLQRRATRISLKGVLTGIMGTEARDALEALRKKFRGAEPVSFVSDITTATRVDKVIIEELGVRELAGKPERFEYAFALREYIPPPKPTQAPPPSPTPPPPRVDTGTLVVEVTVEGEPSFDFSRVTVSLQGTQDDGTALTRTLTQRTDNVWTEEHMPPGQYTVTAVAANGDSISGSAQATVRAGQTTRVQIILRRGSVIARAFVVHFWFDKAFVEPCMRHVLKQVVAYAQGHADEKLVIVGHTDLVGSADYNQALSERRARSVYAALTVGRDPAAIDEWNTLRQNRAGALALIQDNWGVREYQYMLQDLAYYAGNIDEQHGPATDAAVREFQQDHGLTVTGIVGDATWKALLTDYLKQDNLALPESHFLPNCPGEILKWLGCGEQDPVKNTQDAWRPNRRVELLFVNANALPCQVPQPVTFDKPQPGVVGTRWCLGGGDPNKRCCFLARTPQPDRWLVQPAESGSFTVQGAIRFEDGTPLANNRYVLISPDGEDMNGEQPSGPGSGRPIPGRTAADGTFSYPGNQKGPGTYNLAVLGPFVARAYDQPPGSDKGNEVCFRLPAPGGTPQTTLVFVLPISARPAPTPTISPASSIVVVKKPHTNPARKAITLGTSLPFHRAGTLTRSSDAVRLFTAATGGAEITFNGTDNVFTGAQLAAGIQLFAEAARASAAPDDVVLTLTLTPPPTPASSPAGPPATATMTSAELTLDLAHLPEPTLPGRVVGRLQYALTGENRRDIETVYLAHLRAADPEARRASLYGLAQLNHPDVAEHARSMLGDGDDQVVVAASSILLPRADQDPAIRDALARTYATRKGDPDFPTTVSLLEAYGAGDTARGD